MIGRRGFMELLAAVSAAVALPMPDPAKAGIIAHTKEEGGKFYAGFEPNYHSVFFQDGTVFDRTLERLGINKGWRDKKTPEELLRIQSESIPSVGGYDARADGALRRY